MIRNYFQVFGDTEEGQMDKHWVGIGEALPEEMTFQMSFERVGPQGGKRIQAGGITEPSQENKVYDQNKCCVMGTVGDEALLSLTTN